jgi:hypothetical protein
MCSLGSLMFLPAFCSSSNRSTRNAEELQGGQKANTHILRISLVDKVEVSGLLPILSGLGCSLSSPHAAGFSSARATLCVANPSLTRPAHASQKLGAIVSEAHAEQLPSVPRELVEKREAEGLRRMEREITRVGKGVSQTAQALFDTLDKTYALRWQGADMVNQELGFVIKPPYTSESVTARDPNALDRIKKVVDTINKRIAA